MLAACFRALFFEHSSCSCTQVSVLGMDAVACMRSQRFHTGRQAAHHVEPQVTVTAIFVSVF